MTPLPSKQCANTRSDGMILSSSKQAKQINGLRSKKIIQQYCQDQLSVLIALRGNNTGNKSLLPEAWQQLSGKLKLLWSTLSSLMGIRSGVSWFLPLLTAFLFWRWSYLKLISDLSSSYLILDWMTEKLCPVMQHPIEPVALPNLVFRTHLRKERNRVLGWQST